VFTGPGTVSYTSVVDPAFTGTVGQLVMDATWNGSLVLDSALTDTGPLDVASGSITGDGARLCGRDLDDVERFGRQRRLE
jgi:hypothetical protein